MDYDNDMPTDIDLKNPLFKLAPRAAHPYIRLARLDRPAGIWFLLLPCWWAVLLAHQGVFNMGLGAWVQMELFFMGAVLMRAAGCVVNDLWDRDLDAAVARTKPRPLASGEVSFEQAGRFLVALLLPSFVILLCLGKAAIVLGLLSLPLIVVYPLMKRVTWWPQAFLGLTFNWGALMGFAAAEGKIGTGALLLYAGGFFWTLAYDTIYAHQDIADDARIGVKSTARLFGKKSQIFVGFFYASALFLIFCAKFAAFPSFLAPLLFTPACGQAWRTVRDWDPDDPASSLAAFKRSGTVGWLLLPMMGV